MRRREAEQRRLPVVGEEVGQVLDQVGHRDRGERTENQQQDGEQEGSSLPEGEPPEQPQGATEVAAPRRGVSGHAFLQWGPLAREPG